MTTSKHVFIWIIDQTVMYILKLFVRFFEWETLKGGKKQPYFIYFKDDGKLEAKEEDTSACEDVKCKEEGVAMPQIDTEEQQTVSMATVKKEDASSQSGSGTKRLLTMAGLFDHWKPPKVSEVK